MENPNEFIRRIQAKNKSEQFDIALLHYGFCQSVGGWVSVEEFLDLPIGIVFGLLEAAETAQKYIKKKKGHGLRRRV